MRRIRFLCPKGVTVHRRRRTWWDQVEPSRPQFELSIKSRGRTGAKLRSLLMRLTVEQREAVGSAWYRGSPAEIMVDG